jgi:DNA end-binding protein Ku
LRFADELVDTEQFTLPADKSLRKPELDMAKLLIENLATEWQPQKYVDEYQANLMRIIQGKAKGKKVALKSEEEPRGAEVVDLMERLRRSLAQKGGKNVAETAPPRRTKSGGTRKSKKRRAA